MSTQDPNAGVPVTILPDNDLQRVRLLELPPELLALVQSENPPRLQLKSKEPLSDSVKDANSVLCTPDKTYNIRQVSTSNSVYLVRPHKASGSNEVLRKPGVEAVAKCDTTIELLPTSTTAAASYIKAALPTYASTGNYGSQKSVAKDEVFSHIPLSEAECEAGFSELACFESQDPPGCYVPSGKVKAEIWQAATTAAVADSIDLTSPFPKTDIPAFAIDLPGDWPSALVAAVLRSASSETPGGHLAVNEEKAVRLAGLSLLQAKSEGRPMEATTFLKAWRDTVPEAWRSMCEFVVLQGYYELHDNGSTIKYIDGLASSSSTRGTATEAKSLGAKRKWHEKFRASKKTA